MGWGVGILVEATEAKTQVRMRNEPRFPCRGVTMATQLARPIYTNKVQSSVWVKCAEALGLTFFFFFLNKTDQWGVISSTDWSTLPFTQDLFVLRVFWGVSLSNNQDFYFISFFISVRGYRGFLSVPARASCPDTRQPMVFGSGDGAVLQARADSVPGLWLRRSARAENTKQKQNLPSCEETSETRK